MTTSYRDGLLLEEYLAPHLGNFDEGKVGAAELYAEIIEDINKLDSDYREIIPSLPEDEGVEYTERALKHMAAVGSENIVKAMEIIVDQLKDDEDISVEEQEENGRILAAQMYTDGELHEYMTQVDRDRYAVLPPGIIQQNISNPRILSKFADGLLARERLKGYEQFRVYGKLGVLNSLVGQLPDRSEQGAEFAELKLLMGTLPDKDEIYADLAELKTLIESGAEQVSDESIEELMLEIKVLPQRIAEETLGYREKITKLNKLISKYKERIEILSQTETQESGLEEKLAEMETKKIEAQGRVKELEIQLSELKTTLDDTKGAKVITNTVWGEPEQLHPGLMKYGDEVYLQPGPVKIDDASAAMIKEMARALGLSVSGTKATVAGRIKDYSKSD